MQRDRTPSSADLRGLLEQILAHEGHDDIVVCLEEIFATTRAAMTVLDHLEAARV